MESEENYLYKNTVDASYDVLRQSFRKINFRFGKREILVLGASLIILAVFVFIPSIINKTPIFDPANIFVFITVGFIYVFYAGVYLFMPSIIARRIISKRPTKEPYIIESFFSDDECYIRVFLQEEKVVHYDYSKVIFITESEDLLFLQFNDKKFIFLDKKGFENEDEPGFVEFIKEKCQNAKIKIKG